MDVQTVSRYKARTLHCPRARLEGVALLAARAHDKQ